MATGILADHDVERHARRLLHLFEAESRSELWQYLNLAVQWFPDVGLSADAKDKAVWQLCQQRQLVLFTANRNRKDPDSLTAVIESMNNPSSLPVFTLADDKRFLRDTSYAERVADRFLDYLFDLDSYLGAGRLYLP
jgi:hypothetical protein